METDEDSVVTGQHNPENTNTSAEHDRTGRGETSPGTDAGQCRPGEVAGPDSALLVTAPDSRSFTVKYTLACVPVILVLISIVIRTLLEGVSASLLHGIPGMFSSVMPTMTSIATISVYLIAPVSIFLIAAAIGWTLRSVELWTGTALALALSAAAGFIMMTGSGTAIFSERYIAHLLQWIAFFIQPFSILSVILVLFWLEKFRRSIVYEIHRDSIHIRGGVWRHQEHILPHHQTGRIILEQDLLGRRFNYGTVIPLSLSRWGAETSIRGVGAGGQKDNLGAIIGFAKGREEASRTPLDCLYGIPDPQKARDLVTDLVMRTAAREEEQVSYLKQICDKI